MGLNALQDSFRDFKVLGVPCNQFGLQEPGANGTEILHCLEHVRPGGGFQPNFQLTEKIEVNGEGEHPMYSYMKSLCPSPTQTFADVDRLFYSPLMVGDIRWNFEKFLLDREGQPVARYSHVFLPEDMQDDIQNLLIQTAPPGGNR